MPCIYITYIFAIKILNFTGANAMLKKFILLMQAYILLNKLYYVKNVKANFVSVHALRHTERVEEELH
jgi:hypothetical protein